jgi:sortase (surface protein transpeptidase)
MNRSTRPARALPTARVLLLVLAITTGWTEAAPGTSRPAAGPGTETAVAGAAWGSEPTARDQAVWPLGSLGVQGFTSVINRAEHGPEPVITAARVAEPKAKPVKEPKPAPKPTYSGTNRFWIPSLGMNYKVHLFECTRQRDPDNYMYRWGCAGENNVYILGHAYSVMKPLHDLYVRGRLKVGMVAIYANANGKVTWYRVTEWRVVDPVDSHWAIADQPRPSMTLQTCVGKDGRYRLNVRLVAFR